MIGGVLSFFIPHQIRSGKNIKRCMRSHGLGDSMRISYTKYIDRSMPRARIM
jgi:hypothetical protein